jgi:hypothetical protein
LSVWVLGVGITLNGPLGLGLFDVIVLLDVVEIFEVRSDTEAENQGLMVNEECE